jgi:hypothetical protein
MQKARFVCRKGMGLIDVTRSVSVNLKVKFVEYLTMFMCFPPSDQLVIFLMCGFMAFCTVLIV